MSPKALSASVTDIGSVVSMIDRIAGSAPGNGSRAAVGEDLVAMTNCRLQARNLTIQDGMTGTRKIRRYTSAMPLNIGSSASSISDSFKQLNGPETSDLESTATSSVKRPKIEANHALLEEIREINQRLIDTVVDISEEDVDPTAAASATEGGEGTIVKCSFSAVALSPNLKSQYTSAQMSPIQPLRLLVPTNYPNCSPILLDKLPVEISKEYKDLSAKAKSRFSISLRSLSQPMSLGEIARTWDVCARAVISEHAQQSGNPSEREHIANNPSLRGFEVIDEAKAAIEALCPQTVSCADILAFAARDSSCKLGGINYAVRAGRRDGRVSREDEVAELPPPFFNAQQLADNFARKGMSADEMVTLSGAHSIGVSHCSSFSERLYSFNATHAQDPSMDPRYAAFLKTKCPPPSANGASGDQTLMNSPSTQRMVVNNARNGGAWAAKFAKAMVHMGSLDVLTGTQGEIRRLCSVVN
ncbi:hypothetical protein GH714_033490 [Hevea brasiliensis]|uniref:peroxidase n=1 Tax=Hevea brasiliensis TaxID=3981 RepID=A0A6A6NDS9_HEVBR|nr:hypothetical protein GH714_033490 [Hevea brasiliensis]